MKKMKFYLMLVFLIISRITFCQSNMDLILELKSIVFSDANSIEIKVITENKSSFSYKAPKAKVDFKKLEDLCNILQERNDDALFDDLTKIIIYHNQKYEKEWLFAHKLDKSYEWNEIWTNMEIRDKVSELLEITRVAVYLNNSKMTTVEKYGYLREFYLSGWNIKRLDRGLYINWRKV